MNDILGYGFHGTKMRLRAETTKRFQDGKAMNTEEYLKIFQDPQVQKALETYIAIISNKK